MEPMADIRFDGWALHRSSGELVKDGVRLRLPRQALVILEELLARPGEVVTREELIARLWPRGVVDFDTALNSAVRRLRTALGDHADTARYIETLPKRGYRFIGTVESPSVAPVAAQVVQAPRVIAPLRLPRWRVAAAVTLGLATLLVATAGIEQPNEPAERAAVDRELAPATGSVAPQANERYVLARYLLQRRADGDVARSLDNFAQAVAIDPTFARAWAGLASAYWLETVEGRMPASQGLAGLRAAAERAIALDPHMAEAHLRLANYWSRNGKRDIAARHEAEAFAAEPEHPLALSLRASTSAGEGRLEEAIALQRRAVAMEPLSVPSRRNLAVWLYLADRPAQARDELASIREIDRSATDQDGLISMTLVVERQFESALQLASDGPRDPSRLQALALAYAGLGREQEADRTLAELMGPATGADPIRIAEVYAFRGQPDLAFEWLHAAAESDGREQCKERSCWPLEMAERSPLLESLRSDPRWEPWTRSVRRRQS